MDSQYILPCQVSAPAGTGATTIVSATGRTNSFRHLAGLLITTINAVAATLTISDGSKTVMVINYPNSAAAPTYPFMLEFAFPLEQSLPNQAWTLTPSANASGFNVTAQFVEQ